MICPFYRRCVLPKNGDCKQFLKYVRCVEYEIRKERQKKAIQKRFEQIIKRKRI